MPSFRISLTEDEPQHPYLTVYSASTNKDEMYWLVFDYEMGFFCLIVPVLPETMLLLFFKDHYSSKVK